MSAPFVARCLTAALLVAALRAPVGAADASARKKALPEGPYPAGEQVLPPGDSEEPPTACLRRCPRPAAFAPGALEEKPPASALERKLMARVKLDIADQSLKDAIEILGRLNHLNIYIDRAALEAAGVNLSQLTSLKVENISLKSALNLLLKQAKLTYVIKDEVLQITTADEARGHLKQITYPVAELVIPPSGLQTIGDGAGRSLEDRLIKLITATVSPATWSEVGGKGTIQYYPVGMALVVNQTQDVQEQITDLLAALRRLQDVTITIQTHLITIPHELYARLRGDCHLRGKCPAGCQAAAPTILNGGEMRQLLEAAQADRRTTCMQAPRLNAFNGQTATIDVTGAIRAMNGVMKLQKQECLPVGFKMTVEPVVSADRRYVRLKLAAELTSAAANMGPMPVQVPNHAVAQTYTVADGLTLVLGGWKTVCESSTECGCPGHCELPVVGELFGNVVRSRHTVRSVLLVTPRIVITEPEEETIHLGNLPGKACTAPAPCSKAIAPAPCSVLDNLEKLEKARRLMGQVELHMSSGNTDGARCALEQILRLCPGSWVAEQAQAALSRLGAGDSQGTEEAAEQAEPANDTAEAATLVQRYQRACAAGRLREAQRLAHKALALDPACFSK